MRKARPEQGEGHVLNLKPNPYQIFLYLFFELVALCEHSAKFGGQAGDVFFGKVAVLAVYHVAHVAGIYEEGFAGLLLAMMMSFF